METPDHFPSAPEERRALWQQRGIELENHFGWPLGWGLLADEQAHLERLRRFYREQRSVYPSPSIRRAAEEAGEPLLEGGRVAYDDGLTESATAVTAQVQAEFADRRHAPLGREAAELSFARWVALEALWEAHDNRTAKRIQAEVAPGEPLALCVGKGWRAVPTSFGNVSLRPQGCRQVFEDAAYGRGDMWPRWCPVCQTRKPGRDQERALQRRARIARG